MLVSAHFAEDRSAFRILDHERHEWIDALTPDTAAEAIDAILDRPPRHMSEIPPNLAPEFLEVATRVRELAPELVVLWDRERSKRGDPWDNVLIVEPPPEGRFGGRAVCHFSKERSMWGIGLAAHATQAYWARTPSEAAEAIRRYIGPRGRP
jgi:hypothetical protein